MNQLSLITKLQTVLDLIISKRVYLMILALTALLTIIFITTNGSNRKQSRRAYILLYLAAFIFLIFEYGSSLSTLVNYAINQVFITYYFPNIVIYLIMLIITNIVLWKTLFNDKLDIKLKVINEVAFAIITYLFILVIATVNNLKLDVFNITELYSSNSVRSILELSMFIFVFWMVILLLYYLIRKYQYKHNIIKIESFTNYNIINDFDIKKAYKVSNKPIIEETPQVVEEKNPTLNLLGQEFTLDEYKIMIKILKEERAKKEQHEEDNPLTELNKLYQSIRD